MASGCIVVGVDGTARADTAAEWAAGEALRVRAVLRVVHVGPVDSADHSARAARRLLASFPGLEVEAALVPGVPAGALAAQAAGAELLVLGVRGDGTPLGPTACALSERSLVAVALVPSRPRAGGRAADRIAVGVGAPRPAGRALEFAFERARNRGLGLRAIRAWKAPVPIGPLLPPEADRATWEDQEVQSLSDALRPWKERFPEVPVLEDVVLLSPERALATASERAPLLVVGRRGAGLGPATAGLTDLPHGLVVVVPE
ncbi:universal stress protein [Streptomyces sp. NPDC004856]|uniref:universal stress protein n=2 Tax=Streptomyces TaxID=1883 RepID=UPI0033A22D30